MKIIKQFFIIALFTFFGEWLSTITPFPVPGSVIGLIALAIALETKLVKLESINTVGTWLREVMAFLFVPLTVGLMNAFDILQANWLELTIIIIVSTSLTFAVTGIAAETALKEKKNG